MSDILQGIGALILIMFYIVCFIAWPLNAIQLFRCDFEESYKGEAIHAVGLFTPTCFITAWSCWDK